MANLVIQKIFFTGFNNKKKNIIFQYKFMKCCFTRKFIVEYIFVLINTPINLLFNY